jgi:hypothetical protein
MGCAAAACGGHHLAGAGGAQGFSGARSVAVEPASPGRLLVVYRVRVDGVTYYLRVAEEAGEDLTTDAQVLARLAGLGVRVPVVVHVEAGPGDLDRSFLIVAALARGAWPAMEPTRRRAGRCGRPVVMPPLINAIEVEGFGWLRRDGLPGLHAELACYAEFVASDLPGRWPGWLAGAFSGGDLEALQAVVDQERQRPVPEGTWRTATSMPPTSGSTTGAGTSASSTSAKCAELTATSTLAISCCMSAQPAPFRCSRTSSPATPRRPPWPGITAI